MRRWLPLRPVLHSPAMAACSAPQAPAKRTVPRPAAGSAWRRSPPSTSAEMQQRRRCPRRATVSAGEAPDPAADVGAHTSRGRRYGARSSRGGRTSAAVAEAPQAPEPQADSSAQGDGPSIAWQQRCIGGMPAARRSGWSNRSSRSRHGLSGIEGWVTVNYTIDEKGRVSDGADRRRQAAQGVRFSRSQGSA